MCSVWLLCVLSFGYNALPASHPKQTDINMGFKIGQYIDKDLTDEQVQMLVDSKKESSINDLYFIELAGHPKVYLEIVVDAKKRICNLHNGLLETIYVSR